MKTLKKWIAFMLAAGLIVSAVKITAMTVLADDSYGYTKIAYEKLSETQQGYDYSNGGIYYINFSGVASYKGIYPPKDAATDAYWQNPEDKSDAGCSGWKFDGTNWVSYYDGVTIFTGPFSSDGSGNDDSDSSSSSLTHEEELVAIAQRAEADAVQQGASDEGFENVGDMYSAAEKGMSAGEYYNNVVTSTPGITHTFTVGQGGNLVVNGVVTNMTATISKVTNRSYVDSARINQPDGVVLNVVDVQYPAVEATINFYMPSVTAEMNIVAMQYNAGTWVNVDVVEVREDHVVLNMKGNGIVAFIGK